METINVNELKQQNRNYEKRIEELKNCTNNKTYEEISTKYNDME